MIIDEEQVLDLLAKSERVFLLEPPYRRKYIPLGLAKISSYVKAHGGVPTFGRHYVAPSDLICCTSLFTTESEAVDRSIEECEFLDEGVPVVLGGVYASLMGDKISERFPHVMVFKGYSKVLDQVIPDYSMLWEVEDPWNDFSFTFTSRGCPNRCAYCAVHRIEKDQWVVPNWRDLIVGNKEFAMISDNNLSAYPDHLVELVEFLAAKKKRVVFDNGLDCKLITPELAKHLSTVRYVRAGLRLAFDRIEEDGVFQAAIKMLLSESISRDSIMAYVLFNFTDTPKEADYRMRECAKLGIRPYPQKYTPIFRTDSKDYVGKHWTGNLARAFRDFWLFAGSYGKYEFGEWLKVQKDYTITAADLAAWRE